MIGWWPGDGNTKDIQSGNTGQLKNGATFGTGEVGKAFQFDGSNDFVLVKDDTSLHYTDFTYDVWIAPDADSPVGDNYIICKGQVSYYEPLIAISGGAGAHYWHVFVDNVSLNGPNVTYNFQHVAVTRQGTTAKLYVDGVVYDTQTVSSANSADGYDLEFGNIPGFSSSAFFKGRIDEVEIFNRALSNGEIQSIYDAGSAGKCKPTCTPPPSGLSHWWPGDNTATDIQGNNNGTLKNGTTFAGGHVDRAFFFDGVNGYVNLADVDLTPQFTWDMWLNVVDFNDNRAILHNDEGSIQVTVQTDGRVYAQVWNTGSLFTIYITDDPVINLGTWQHLAIVYANTGSGTGTNFKFYVDGALVSASPSGSLDAGGTPKTSATKTFLGIISEPNEQLFQNPFKGRIDEVEFFDRALTDQEVLDLYNAGSAGKCKIGRFYVPDRSTNKIETFDNNGAHVSEFARLFAATGLVFDPSGNLYAASFNPGSIRKFTQIGIGSTFATGLNQPDGLAFDTSWNLYVASSGNNTITKVDPSGVKTTFANSGLNLPRGLAFGPDANLYAGNYGDDTIVQFDSD